MVNGRAFRFCLACGLLVCLGWVAPGLIAQFGGLANRLGKERMRTYRPSPGPPLPEVKAAADLINRGQREAGIRALEGILKRHPTHRQALEALSEAYFQNQRTEEATELLARCLKKHSKSWRCLTMQGRMLLAQGHEKRAVTVLRKAVGVNNADPRAHFHLGRALFRQNKLKRAEVAFNRAMAYRKAGTLTAVHLHLARLYRSWNRPLQEAQVLEWYLRGNSDAGDAEQLRRRIVQLRDGSTGGQP